SLQGPSQEAAPARRSEGSAKREHRRPQQIPPRQVLTFALALCDSVAETDELKSHLAAEPAGIVLAVGLDKHPYWAVEGAEENAGTCGPLPGAGDAYSHMCPKALGRNFLHRCPRFHRRNAADKIKFLLCSPAEASRNELLRPNLLTTLRSLLA